SPHPLCLHSNLRAFALSRFPFSIRPARDGGNVATATLERTPEIATDRPAFKVADLSPAEFGRKEIRLAEQEMPGLMALRARYRGQRPLAGAKIMSSEERRVGRERRFRMKR